MAQQAVGFESFKDDESLPPGMPRSMKIALVDGYGLRRWLTFQRRPTWDHVGQQPKRGECTADGGRTVWAATQLEAGGSQIHRRSYSDSGPSNSRRLCVP